MADIALPTTIDLTTRVISTYKPGVWLLSPLTLEISTSVYIGEISGEQINLLERGERARPGEGEDVVRNYTV